MHTQGHSHLRIPCMCTHRRTHISAHYARTHTRTQPNSSAHSRTCTGKDTAVRARSSYGQGYRHPHAPVHILPADPWMRTHSHTRAHTHTQPHESPQHLHRRRAVPRVRSPSWELPRRRIAAGLSSPQDTRTCPRGDRRTSCPHALPCLLAPFWPPAILGTLQPPRGAVQSMKTPQPGGCSQQHRPPGDFAEENHAEKLPGPRWRLAPLCTKPSRGAGLCPPPASLLPRPGGGQRATPQLRFPS